MIVGVALMALPATAQTFGTKYAEQPNAAFQSTSTMTGSGSTYSANPTLNNDGTATYNGASTAPTQGPRRAKKADADGDGIDDETGEIVPITPDPSSQIPLGDAVLPLLLCALAFCGVVYLRRRRSAA